LVTCFVKVFIAVLHQLKNLTKLSHLHQGRRFFVYQIHIIKKTTRKGGKLLVLNDWTTFTTLKLHLHSFAIAHRRASARLSLVVKQLPRWFEPTTLVVQQKNTLFLIK
jgi:hypothetical protein